MASKSTRGNGRGGKQATAPRGRPKSPKPPVQTPSSSESDSEQEFDDVHRDDVSQIGHHLEQGELIEDTESEMDDQPPKDMSKLVKDLQRQQLELTAKLEKMSEISNMDTFYDWKKEGLKKQYSVLEHATSKINLAIASLGMADKQRSKELMLTSLSILNDTKKERKITDASEGGWETVNLYRSHPVAENAEDDRRIRRADKLAKERLSAKQRRGKPASRGRYQRRSHYWQQRDDFPSNNRDFPYKSTSSSRSQHYQQRNTYVPDRRHNSNTSAICYFCGLQGHWQDSCPQKSHNRRDR